jgi:hypothetical protein
MKNTFGICTRYKSMEIVEKFWFTADLGTTGIIVIKEDITGDQKAYIGVVGGQDEAVDTQHIINFGQHFHYEVAKRLEQYLRKEKGKKEKKKPVNIGIIIDQGT